MKPIQTKHGKIVAIGKGDRLYLKGYYRGQEFTRSLDTDKIGLAKEVAKEVREKAEKDIEERLSKPTKEAQARAVKLADQTLKSDLYRVDNERPGFLEEYYPTGKTNLNTRYDVEKLLDLFLRALAGLKEVPQEKLTRVDLTPALVKRAFVDLKAEKIGVEGEEKGRSKKTAQKVSITLKKYLRWTLLKHPEDHPLWTEAHSKEFFQELKKLTPKNPVLIRERQKKLPDELWTKEEWETYIAALKDPTSLLESIRETNRPIHEANEKARLENAKIKEANKDRREKVPAIKLKRAKLIEPTILPLDYELFWVMRFMGLPPSDTYELTELDFKDGKKGLILDKDRAKNKADTVAAYNQPVDKGDPHDKETERILRARFKVVKKGKRIFEQPMLSKRARNDKQDDKTRWVSNLSGRRIALQAALGLTQKGAKGLRATFVCEWLMRGIPEIVIDKWAGWAPGSTMKQKFYATVEAQTDNWRWAGEPKTAA